MYSESRSEKLHNEDAFYGESPVWIVVDGASALCGGDLMKTGSDAAWLSHAICDANQTLADCASSIEDNLKCVLRTLHDQFPACMDVMIPSCALAIARVNSDRRSLEYFVLGDCSLMIETDKDVLLFSDPAVGTFDGRVIEMMQQLVHEDGGSFLAKRQDQRIKDMLLANRMMKNNPEGGYSIADLNGDWFSSVQGELPLECVKRFALYSDGFDQLQSFSTMDNDAFLNHLFESPDRVLDELFAFQDEDAACTRLPRLKKRDDTTLVLVDRNDF